MQERENFRDMVKLVVSMFKEDVDCNLAHMIDIIFPSEPPFQRSQGAKNQDCESKEKGTSRANDDEVESARKY